MLHQSYHPIILAGTTVRFGLMTFVATSYRKLCMLCVLMAATIGLYAQNAKTVPTPIVIKTLNNLQYDIARFQVKPGEKIRIVLDNVSDMAHNLLIVKPGTRLDVVNAAMQLAEKGPQMNYIPASNTVLWSIPLVSPGQTKSVTFTAPAKPGIYPYVCTYPGHGFVMYGAMYVIENGSMPAIQKDINIPTARRVADKKNRNDKKTENENPHSGHLMMEENSHPYALNPPYLYHAFIDGVSPAAIAVRLPRQLSYCWDNGACRLSLAWKGDFLDMSDLWKGHFNASAKILGDIFFRDHIDYPIRFGEKAVIPTVIQYKGYRLINDYPEFHYTLNGLDVYELIKESGDGNGLVRSFRVPQVTDPLWIFTNPEDDAITYESSAGKWKDGRLELSAEEARAFTVTMTSYFAAYKKK